MKLGAGGDHIGSSLTGWPDHIIQRKTDGKREGACRSAGSLRERRKTGALGAFAGARAPKYPAHHFGH